MLFAVALVLSGSTLSSAAHTCCRSSRPAHRAPLHAFRAPDAPSTAFALKERVMIWRAHFYA
eukprot:775650-Pleurochrysis_carterae.AAC.1